MQKRVFAVFLSPLATVWAPIPRASRTDRIVALVRDLAGLYVVAYAYGRASASPRRPERVAVDQVIAMLREYWQSLPPTLFPHTLALLDMLLEGGPDERFEFGLDVIVRGSHRCKPNRPVATRMSRADPRSPERPGGTLPRTFR